MSQPITDPDQITGLLRQLDIFQRERHEVGANTSLSDLNQEAQIVTALLIIDNNMISNLMVLNILGESVRKSIEGE